MTHTGTASASNPSTPPRSPGISGRETVLSPSRVHMGMGIEILNMRDTNIKGQNLPLSLGAVRVRQRCLKACL
jgi:hypothetical protein